MLNNISQHLVFGIWSPVDSIIDGIKTFFGEMFKNALDFVLKKMSEIFGLSLGTIQQNVAETPETFSPGITSILHSISNTAVLPIAGLILTYIFVYEIYELAVEKNKSGSDIEGGQIFFLIFKTACGVALVSNAFEICMAFFDLGSFMVKKIPQTALSYNIDIKQKVLDLIPDNQPGTAMIMLFLGFIALIITLILSAIIILVCWSRIITILLYISIAPLPFATFMNSNWVGAIGQNYVKNLLALAIQGYFMLICVVVYSGLLEKSTGLMDSTGSPIYGMVLMVVSMAIIVLMLTKTHGLAKSVVNAS